jgi:hypothetical protein
LIPSAVCATKSAAPAAGFKTNLEKFELKMNENSSIHQD